MKTIIRAKAVLFLISVIFFVKANAQTPVTPVDGVYTITTADELRWVSTTTTDFNGEIIILANDIDLQDIPFKPIGSKSSPFKGSFDGQAHVIRNLKIEDSAIGNNQMYGLFGYVQSTATNGASRYIRNLGIVNATMNITYSTEGIFGNCVGFLIGSTAVGGKLIIHNCYVENGQMTINDNPKANYTGGLVGLSHHYIRNCYVKNSTIKVNVTGIATTSSTYRGWVGGITGYINTASCNITDCYTDSTTIISNRSYTGGIVGDLYSASTISNCFVTGDIRIEDEVNNRVYPARVAGNDGSTMIYAVYAGGIIGGKNGIFKNCYMTGNIQYNIGFIPHDILEIANVHIGGIAAYSHIETIVNSYMTGNISCDGNNSPAVLYNIGGISGCVNNNDARIMNNLFVGNITASRTESANIGNIIGLFAKTDDSKVLNNYYTNTVHPAIGYNADTNSESINLLTAESSLKDPEFYYNPTNWNYLLDNSIYWELSSYKYIKGQFPQLRRLVSSYNSTTWDGISMVMAPPMNGKYTINNAVELMWLAREINKAEWYNLEDMIVELGSDIDLSNHYFPGISTPIRPNDRAVPFKGVFDGKGFTVRNFLLFEYMYGKNIGLFGEITDSAVLKNINIDNVQIRLEKSYLKHDMNTIKVKNIGALVGLVSNADSIVNCHATNIAIYADTTETTTLINVGGLLGKAQILKCFKNISVKMSADMDLKSEVAPYTNVGGVIGKTEEGYVKISNVYAYPEIRSNGDAVGGMIGYIFNDVVSNGNRIDSCFVVEGSIRTKYPSLRAGGLIGRLNILDGKISRCYSAISVEGTTNVGGFIGQMQWTVFTMFDDRWFPHIHANYASGNVTLVSTPEMVTLSQYGGGFIGNNQKGVVENCYATGNVSSEDKITGNRNYLGGLIGTNHNELAVLNCYAAGEINMENSFAGEKYIGALVADSLINVINCFSDCVILPENDDAVYFKGLTMEALKGNEPDYIPLTSYHPYQDKLMGTKTQRENFKTPSFFTNPANWTEKTITIQDDIWTKYTTKEWNTEVWYLETGKYPVLRYTPQTPTGIIDVSTQRNTALAYVYPNPCQQQLNIHFAEQGFFHFKIMDISGRILYQGMTSQDFISFDISNYPSGVYLLNIHNGKKQSNTKIVKVK